MKKCARAQRTVSQPTIQKKRTGLYVGVAVTVGVIIVVSVMVSFLFLSGFFNPPAPEVEITSTIQRQGGGLISNYWVTVDISLYNHGGGGEVTVWAEITYEYGEHQETWKKAQTIYIASKEPKDVSITFEFDASIYFGEFSNRVWTT